MGYVAVKGGTLAIEASIKRLKYERLKHRKAMDTNQIESGMRCLIDQVMSESSLYSEPLAALAIKQAEGSPEEAVFLLRAFRSTLPRKHYSKTADTDSMRVERRISAAFKDLPGGQILGPCYDYTHRLLDFSLREETDDRIKGWLSAYQKEIDRSVNDASLKELPRISEILRRQGFLSACAENEAEPLDVTKESLTFPACRSQRLQILTRGQTGAVTALGYASLRGFGDLHPTVGELRVGALPVYIGNPMNGEEAGDEYFIGDIRVTEAETLIPCASGEGRDQKTLTFALGYGLCYGQNETKAIAMSLLDQCLQAEAPVFPTQDEEFVLMHVDSVEATGFISHLKLPHYVTFASKLDSVQKTGAAGKGATIVEDVL